MRANAPVRLTNGRRNTALAALLFAGTFLLFVRSVGFGYIPLDDPFYVTENPWVRSGPTTAGVAWALTSYEGGNWHPLTWISLMVDAALSGGQPWSFHLTNVVCHAAAATALFVALNRMTGEWARSAVVAGLFACHPQHVESVAWISERKDVLSTLFGFIALAAYSNWVKQPTRLRFSAVFLAHAASLATKPMWVTLPFVLLLLDLWPLNRLGGTTAGGQPTRWWPRIAEKIPLFALSAAASTMALVAQKSAGAVTELRVLPPAIRAGTAICACADYLVSTVWPSRLAVFYPYAFHGVPLERVGLTTVGLLAVTVVALLVGRRAPYLRTGWLWYVVTLLPVIGIVQVGMQAKADRYTYVPLVGIFIAGVWGIGEFVDRMADRAASTSNRRRFGAAAAALTIATSATLAWFQLTHWESGVALFSHAIAVTGPNAVARNCLGRALLETGKDRDAEEEFREALRFSPEYSDARSNLAGTLVRLGRMEEAMDQYRETIRVNPKHVLANANLGRILLARSDFGGAVRSLETAVAGRPGHAETRAAFGAALLRLGRFEDAVVQLKEALRLDPSRLDARMDLGFALAQSGDLTGAEREARTVIHTDPSNAAARSLLNSLSQARPGTQ